MPTGESDTRYVEAVAKGIGEHLDGGYKVIVNKSTVPIGSGDWVRMIVMDGISERQQVPVGAGAPADKPETPQFDVVSNPEFLREGSAVYDTFNPDRIVLGGSNPKAIAMMKELYEPIVERKFADDQSAPQVPILVTDLSSAEMVKYASNSSLATKISFINEVANICDRVGADVEQLLGHDVDGGEEAEGEVDTLVVVVDRLGDVHHAHPWRVCGESLLVLVEEVRRLEGVVPADRDQRFDADVDEPVVDAAQPLGLLGVGQVFGPADLLAGIGAGRPDEDPARVAQTA